jgi:16S rRNA (guanine527-N7)-methyltransferase
MNVIGSEADDFCHALSANAALYEVKLSESDIARLSDYYKLLIAWNPRQHLVAPCSPKEFATRHVLESLLLLPHLREDAHIADIGSGAGLPIVPNLVLRPDIHARLIESTRKKAIFLREALRRTKTAERASVIAERFENVPTPSVDYVTVRALDRFGEMFLKLVRWAPRASTLLLFGGHELQKGIEEARLKSSRFHIPNSERRFLFVIELKDRRP